MSHASFGARKSALVLGLFAILSIAVAKATPPVEKRSLTVADAIETTRIIGDIAGWRRQPNGTLEPDLRAAVVSPNGKRYVSMLVRGDIARDGNWMELISGSLESARAALRVDVVARLFTRSLGSIAGYGSSALTSPHFNPVTWIDDGAKVAFLFGDGLSPIQVVTVNVETREVSTVTNHPTDVVSFAFAPQGGFIYSAKVAHSDVRSQELRRRGFAVSNADAFSFLRGDVDGYGTLDRMWNSQMFAVSSVGGAPRLISTNHGGFDLWTPLMDVAFSPDGRFAIVDGSPDEIPAVWEEYTDEIFRMGMRESRRDRRGFYARFIKQLCVVDLTTGTARPLWDAPNATHVQAVWSPDSKHVLVGPTYVPLTDADSEPLGMAGRAVVTVEVATGSFQSVPVAFKEGLLPSLRLRWFTTSTVEIDDGTSALQFSKINGKWVQRERRMRDRPTIATRVRMEVRQSLNKPPVLYAVDTKSQRAHMAYDPNPRLRSEFTLGHVEVIEWNDRDGQKWKGLLYYPVNFDRGRRVPLVLQTQNFGTATTFSLYGPGFPFPGLGPGYSIYAAQALANRGIAVLQIENKEIPGTSLSPREPEMYSKAFESAIEHLDKEGVIDARRVGLAGFSRTGWYVEYALTHSPFPYAAAISSDNYDASYLQALLGGTNDEFEQDNGARAFGEGLKTWIDRAPGFNAERIRTPLRLQVESGGLHYALSKWEMFSRLRQLQKPVELFVVPDAEHGSHGLQNPRQCLAAQEGAVDWFDFWLNEHETTDSTKREQYARWRQLRELRDGVHARD